MIKTFFKAFTICVFSLPFSSFAENWAQAELAKALSEDAAVSQSIAAERAKIKARIDALSRQIDAADSQISEAEKAGRDTASLAEKSKFYDAMADGVCADVRNFLNPSIPQRASSLRDSAAVLEAEISKAFDGIFSPLKPVKTSAKRAKSDVQIEGESFRIGGFRYFLGGGTAGMLSADGVLYMEECAPQIRDFASLRTNSIPADVSRGAMLDETLKARSFAEDVSLGGVWMYPILFFGILSAAVCAVKFVAFAFIRRAPKNVVKKILACCARGGEGDALKLASRSGYPYSILLSELVKSRNLDASLIEEISYEHMLSAGEKLFGGLSILSVTAAVAPLFGLLGTVTGIIKTFADLSTMSSEQAQFVSAGISEALITTEYGLVVAIPAFVAHAILSRRAKGVLSDMEKLASSFLAGNKN